MIKKILQQFCCPQSAKASSAFSSFFTESSSGERKKIMEEVIKDTNKDQKALVEKYEKIVNGSTSEN